jgi:hypothetical protein
MPRKRASCEQDATAEVSKSAKPKPMQMGFVVCRWDENDPRIGLVRVLGTRGKGFVRVQRSHHTRYRCTLRESDVYATWDEAKKAAIVECTQRLLEMEEKVRVLRLRLADLHAMTVADLRGDEE